MASVFIKSENQQHRLYDPARWAARFILSAAAILLITGSANIASAFGHSRILSAHDPVFAITLRSLFLMVGLVEVTLACICLFAGRIALKLASVAWLTAGFVMCRISLFRVGCHKMCPCLGGLTDELHMPAKAADLIMNNVLLYLLFGSAATLFSLFLLLEKGPISNRRASPPVPGGELRLTLSYVE
jgi:hypothetical protein